MKVSTQLGASLAVVAIIIGAVIAAAGGGMLYYHQQPAFCADMCHVMQPYEDSWVSSDLLANVHSQADIECLDCHEATVQEQVQELIANVTGDFEQPLRERKMPMEQCLSCHEHDSYANLAEATSDQEHNPHASHNGELECSLCHNMHRPSELYCTQCHAFDVPEGWVSAQMP